ncbi:hypothetical protein BJ170DRAFT_376852 [Xylariales sp. AK1849]|nr:hypothetical protein BJ170DRAFT_376852 [Xylariales sp. AK1849]
MAPIQKTFSLIPDLPSAFNGADAPAGCASKPPMTTKQAKKAYRAANKGPKLSKAEQRRIELMEQDRIRREFEKERNQARAQKARDKRKEKEEKEKADKKKKGLPLFEVHPSQDTLARFVRKHAQTDHEEKAVESKRQPLALPVLRKDAEKAEVMKMKPIPFPVVEYDDSDGTLSAGDGAEDTIERPPKRQRTGASPEILPIEHVPNQAMFKRPKSRDVEELAVPCTSYAEASIKGATPKPGSFDPDDPSTKEMVDQQIFSESFSADDALFDDIDIDSIDANTTTQQHSRNEGASLPTKPPGFESCPDETTATKYVQAAVPRPTISMRTVPKEIDDARRLSPCPKPAEVSKDLQTMRNAEGPAVHIDLTPRQVKDSTQQSKEPLSKIATVLQPRADNKFAVSAQQRHRRIENIGTADVKDRRLSTTSRPKTSVVERPVPLRQSVQHVYSPQTGLPKGAPAPGSGAIIMKHPVRRPLEAVSSNQITNSTPNRAAQPSTKKLRNECQAASKLLQPPLPKARASIAGPNSFRSPRTPCMGPPPLPPKFKPPNHSTTNRVTSGPKFLHQQLPVGVGQSGPPHVTTPSLSPDHLPPSSTQLFLLSNADDLFPSPSQEVKEIFEDPTTRAEWPSARPIASPPLPRVVPSSRSTKSAQTPDWSRSAVIKSPVRDSLMIVTRPTEARSAKNIEVSNPLAPDFRNEETADVDCMPFLSTQDLFLSSQDLKELEEDTASPRPNHTALSILGLATGPCEAAPPETAISKQTVTPRRGQQIVGTSYERRSSAAMRTADTNERIFHRKMDLQQSSSLPETPSGPHHLKGRVIPGAPALRGSDEEERPRKAPPATADSHATDESIAALLDYVVDDTDDEHPPLSIQKVASVAQQQTSIAPRPSPKPFFTSSGTKERVYLAIERTRTTAWEDEHTRRKAQEDLERLLREEDQKAERLLVENMLEQEEAERVTELAEGPPQAVEDPNRRSRGQSVTAHAGRQALTQKSDCRKNHPQSSWEKMLELLEKAEHGQNPVSASQESDYGETPWDDDDLADL